jgi:hypothetical protein
MNKVYTEMPPFIRGVQKGFHNDDALWGIRRLLHRRD